MQGFSPVGCGVPASVCFLVPDLLRVVSSPLELGGAVRSVRPFLPVFPILWRIIVLNNL